MSLDVDTGMEADSDSEEVSLVLVELEFLAVWVVSGSANGYVVGPGIWIK